MIGDIHGEANLLRALLERLGYREGPNGFGHPSRRAIFLGDYIDRGPAIRETLGIVRQMVERHSALALCGNHELDILLHDTADGRGGWLRPHGGRKTKMHEQTHAEFDGCSEEWADWLRWFQTLPLYLDLPGLRAVHAFWDEKQIAVLRARRSLADGLIPACADKNEIEGAAINRLLKGPEVPLPAGMKVVGANGARRHKFRLRWWQTDSGKTYRDRCIDRFALAPPIPIPRTFSRLLSPTLANDSRPLFFGHYWLEGETPAPLGPGLACLDYGVAGGGPLVAYRWDGERELSAAKYVWVTR